MLVSLLLGMGRSDLSPLRMLLDAQPVPPGSPCLLVYPIYFHMTGKEKERTFNTIKGCALFEPWSCFSVSRKHFFPSPLDSISLYVLFTFSSSPCLLSPPIWQLPVQLHKLVSVPIIIHRSRTQPALGTRCPLKRKWIYKTASLQDFRNI